MEVIMHSKSLQSLINENKRILIYNFYKVTAAKKITELHFFPTFLSSSVFSNLKEESSTPLRLSTLKFKVNYLSTCLLI